MGFGGVVRSLGLIGRRVARAAGEWRPSDLARVPPAVAGGRGFFTSLTDTRFPKRRPSLGPRRKRASLRPPGPYAWVQHPAGEPAPSSQPNEGSKTARGRKARKRVLKVKTFILSEKKKRQEQYAESKKKKRMEKIERKMAAVAREKAWAQRLTELQQLEAAKKAAPLAGS
ncbi:protein translocase subunit [Wolffia australiana]